MKPKYRVAIIGAGRMGGLIEDEIPAQSFSKPYGHFSAYQAIDETEVVAVASRGRERLDRFAARFGLANTYLDYREMLRNERPDIVSITTPALARAEIILEAIAHGARGIYAEKGLCASLAEADEIVAACRSRNVAFNWGAMRRHHDGFLRLAERIAAGEIGDVQFAVMYAFTDLSKHHAHAIDLVGMMLGDPRPTWVEGRLVEAGDPLASEGRAYPAYESEGHRFVPPPGKELGDPMVGFYRVGYEGGAVGYYVPAPRRFDVEVHGTRGRAFGGRNGFGLQMEGDGFTQTIEITPQGESPTVRTIRDLIHGMETGAPTRGNIDVTMNTVEVQFGLAHSHLQGGRVEVPVQDRSLYIPGG